MTETDQKRNGQTSEVELLEQRVAKLEKNQGGQKTQPISPTRRQVLGGILGTGLLFGATGSASAATWSDSDGDNLLETGNDGIDVDEVHANQAYINRPTITGSGKIGAEQAVYSRPRNAVKNRTELVTPGDLSYTSDDQYWPTIIKADEVFSNPVGKYYLYFSGDHGSNSAIGMAYSDNPLGPYTPYGSNPVIDFTSGQDETPRAVWNDQTGELHMYFHTGSGQAQSTELATSTDGLSFTREGVVLDKQDAPNQPGNAHTGYFQAHKFGSEWFAYHLWGGGDLPRFAVSYSEDGFNWFTDPRPLGYNTDQVGNKYRVEWNGSTITKFNGTLWWIGQISDMRSGKGGGSSEDKLSHTVHAPLLNMRQLARQPQTLIEPTETWEGKTSVRDTLRVDGRLFVFYTTDNGTIGGAEIEGGVL
ncbi:hypothetical protein [Haloarcula marina]|uniref:hypothetical protein n=1 Tax=Haloarcula marina TaxID=2961574 RepID=UPI0020B88B90|nr:hypothetical protein [Halomicroarcula marina]